MDFQYDGSKYITYNARTWSYPRALSWRDRFHGYSPAVSRDIDFATRFAGMPTAPHAREINPRADLGGGGGGEGVT